MTHGVTLSDSLLLYVNQFRHEDIEMLLIHHHITPQLTSKMIHHPTILSLLKVLFFDLLFITSFFPNFQHLSGKDSNLQRYICSCSWSLEYLNRFKSQLDPEGWYPLLITDEGNFSYSFGLNFLVH